MDFCMSNLMDVVEQTNVPDMFSKLEQVYLQTLGIKILAVNDVETYPKMGYLLEDPQKFPFLKLYATHFMLDPVKDIAPLLTSYCDQLVASANVSELKELHDAIEKNRIRQAMIETDVGTDAQGECVNLYLDLLYVSVLGRQRQLKGEMSKAVQSISAIMSERAPAAMYKKLIDFYQSEFGIVLYEQSSDDEPDNFQTVLRVDDDYKKIQAHGIDLKQSPNLDSNDVVLILETYFKPIIASLDFADLFKLGMQIKTVNDNLEYADHEDFELARYIGPLHGAIKDQLHAHIEKILEKPDISVHHLALILNHLDLLTEQQGPDDIENYLNAIPDMNERAIQRALSNSELRHIIRIEKIKKYFQRFDQMQLVGAADLLEVCGLKTYLKTLQLQKTYPDIGGTFTLSRLAAPIELGLRKLLNDYKTDVEATVSDIYKTQKLNCIGAMLTKLDDPKLVGKEKIEQIKMLFDQNPTIHQKEPIGRYLYRCLCAFFNKPCQVANYNMTLFKSLSGEEGTDHDSVHHQHYKRLGQ